MYENEELHGTAYCMHEVYTHALMNDFSKRVGYPSSITMLYSGPGGNWNATELDKFQFPVIVFGSTFLPNPNLQSFSVVGADGNKSKKEFTPHALPYEYKAEMMIITESSEEYDALSEAVLSAYENPISILVNNPDDTSTAINLEICFKVLFARHMAGPEGKSIYAPIDCYAGSFEQMQKPQPLPGIVPYAAIGSSNPATALLYDSDVQFDLLKAAYLCEQLDDMLNDPLALEVAKYRNLYSCETQDDRRILDSFSGDESLEYSKFALSFRPLLRGKASKAKRAEFEAQFPLLIGLCPDLYDKSPKDFGKLLGIIPGDDYQKKCKEILKELDPYIARPYNDMKNLLCDKVPLISDIDNVPDEFQPRYRLQAFVDEIEKRPERSAQEIRTSYEKRVAQLCGR